VIMSPRLRSFVLTLHVTCSAGLIGAVAGFLALGVAGLISEDAVVVRATYVAMELITWSILVPLSFASLLTGVVQSLATPWGLFRHYWVLAKLLLTVAVVIILLLQTEPISYMAAVAAKTTLSSVDLRDLRLSLVLPHAGGGLLVLFLIIMLSVYKPRGLTRYGWNRQHARRT
jgi:hypothetical protein